MRSGWRFSLPLTTDLDAYFASILGRDDEGFIVRIVRHATVAFGDIEIKIIAKVTTDDTEHC
jgi:hypothetical protein